MKKMITFLLSLVCLVTLCVIATVYVVELRLAAQQNKPRYQLVFGAIVQTNSEPVPDKPGVVKTQPFERPICFKFDSVTGETWRYVSDFYDGRDETRTTEGFELVLDDPFIYEVTKKTEVAGFDQIGGRFADLAKPTAPNSVP